jgi:hypothetical protein
VATDWSYPRPAAGPANCHACERLVEAAVRGLWRNTAADELTTRTVRLDPVIDWREVRPRRGRPPKSLVKQRQSGLSRIDVPD